MERLKISLVYTVAIMIYLLVVYFLIRKSRNLKKLVDTPQADRVFNSIRIFIISLIVIWSAINAWANSGAGAIIIIPLFIIMIGLAKLRWENLLRFQPFFTYCLILGFTFVYIHILTLLQVIYSNLFG
jgi:hypothetical protein